MKFIVSELKSFLADHRVKVAPDGAFAVKFVKGEVKAGTGESQAEGGGLFTPRDSPGGALITAADTRGFYYGMKTLSSSSCAAAGRRPSPPATSWTGRF